MKKALFLMGLAAAIACGSSAGDMMGEAFDDMTDVPDAGAQSTDCVCEDGVQGEPGPQGEPGLQGEPGPSGVVAATSFLGQGSMDLADVDGWRCEFGTEVVEQLDVAEGERVLITGQGSIVLYNNASDFEFSIAWRQAGDTTNGALGHYVERIIATRESATLPVHATELTPSLTAGTYEFGICLRRLAAGDTFGARRLYGTAMVVNTGIQ